VLNAHTDCAIVQCSHLSSTGNMNNLFLLDSSLLRRRLRRRHRTECVNEIYLKREELGEFHHIWEDLKIDNKRFYSYILVLMNKET
jgi:hypothetical protein